VRHSNDRVRVCSAVDIGALVGEAQQWQSACY